MIALWALIGIGNAVGIADCSLVWHWFGAHVVLTILMLIFLA